MNLGRYNKLWVALGLSVVYVFLQWKGLLGGLDPVMVEAIKGLLLSGFVYQVRNEE